jgi:pilus assembly protein CpaB
LAVAIVLGLVAAVTARNLVSRRPAGVAGKAGPLVVIVKQALLPGQEIKAEDVTTAALPWKEAPQGTFKDVPDVVGRVATVPMVTGQPVLESLLAATGSGSGLQALVTEGMRAITIEVNEFSSVAGLIGPGCAVDVVATIEDSKTKDRIARTIVQDVRVMAVGQRVAATTPAPGVKGAAEAPAADQMFKSVTLLTTPAEAETLELASMIGRPRLVLRGSRDSASTKSNGVTVAQLVGYPDDASADLLTPGAYPVQAAALTERVPATRPVAELHVVKVFKGGVESSVSFGVERGAEPQRQPAAVITQSDTGSAFSR